MKLKYQFEITEIDEEVMAVPLDSPSDGFHGAIRLNPTARFIFENLAEDISLEDLQNKCCTAYPDSDPEKIRGYIVDFIEKLKSEELILL